jgi:hypothetical protein
MGRGGNTPRIINLDAKEVSGQCHTPAALISWKERSVVSDTRLRGTYPIVVMKKTLACTARNRTPVRSHSRDLAIPVSSLTN